jgi:hypothetical protein
MAAPGDTVKLVPITYVRPITPGGANVTITGTSKVSGPTTPVFLFWCGVYKLTRVWQVNI